MEKITRHSLIVFLLGFTLLVLKPVHAAEPVSKNPTRAEQKIQWFNNAKFGLFIHWGLYAIPSGEWQGQEYPFIGEWIMRWAQIPAKRYRQLAEAFNPIHFDAEFIAQLAQDAGMRYLVITSKHHDGFSMFDSDVTEYDIIDATPFDRDPLKELELACRARDIAYGFYYSHAQDWDEPNAAGNTWDFKTRPSERNYEQYLQDKAIPQVRELLRNYGRLGLIWFDTPQLLTKEQALELINLVQSEQPTCLINSRVGHGYGDYDQMGDNQVPSNIYPREWEIPATLNDTWGFKSDDRHWKSTGYLIYRLTDIVSKGGNYLLNIGPKADGTIPQASVKRLHEMGVWLDKNGEAIYDTDPSPFTHDATLNWRCTRKPGKLFIHLLRWPGKTFTLHGLENIVNMAYLLADPDQDLLSYTHKNDTLSVDLPGDVPDPHNSVLVLEIEGEPRISPAYRWDTPRDFITLTAMDCSPHGPYIRYSEYDQSVSGFRQPNDRIRCRPVIRKPGTFTVELEYCCMPDQAGDTFEIRFSGETLTGQITSTDGQYKVITAGDIKVDQTGVLNLTFNLVEPDQSSGIRVRGVRLVRK